MNAIDNVEISNKNTIFVEGHPMLSILYCQALFKSQKVSRSPHKQDNKKII